MRYDAARFRTLDGAFKYPKSARRWYTGTVVAHDKYHAFHFVLDKTDSRLDKDRRELIVFHPKEFVEASSGTTAWMSWCVGRPWRGYQAFERDEELDEVPRPSRETTPLADRAQPSFRGSMLGESLPMGSVTRPAPPRPPPS